MRNTAKATLGGATVLALCIAGIAPAWADPNPIGTSAATGGDIVGVGSDTLQFVDNFVADGVGLTAGYNSTHKTQRIASFDAVNPETQTANDLIRLRGNAASGANGVSASTSFAYNNGSNNLIVRPNGSGAGQTAIALGTSNSEVDYARASSALSSTQQQSTGTGNGLTQAPFATDTLQIAVKTGNTTITVTPTPRMLKEIYEASPDTNETLIRTVGDLLTAENVTGYDTSLNSTELIAALPQAGSGTRKTFLGDIGVTDDATHLRQDQFTYSKTSPGTWVQSSPATGQLTGGLAIVEEHDPSIFINPPSGINSSVQVIAPFSGGRVKMINNGYFDFINTGFKNSVALLAGTSAGFTAAPDTAYGHTRTLYHDFRQTQETQSWVTTFIAAFETSSGSTLETDAGLSQITSANGGGVLNP